MDCLRPRDQLRAGLRDGVKMTMDPRFFTYGEAVCRQVRHATKREKAGIQKELADHLMDHTEALVAAGYTPQDAQDLALDAMGDPVQVGKELNHSYPLGWLVLARGLLVVMVVCLLTLVFYGSDVVYRFDSWWDAKHDPLGTFQSSGSLNGSETNLPPTTLLDIKKELPGGSILHVYGVGAAAAPGDRKETIVYLYAVCYHRMPFLHAAYLPDLTFSCHGHTTSAEWRPNIGFFDVVYRLYPVYVPQDTREITLHYDHYGTRFALEIPLPQEEVRTP